MSSEDKKYRVKEALRFPFGNLKKHTGVLHRFQESSTMETRN